MVSLRVVGFAVLIVIFLAGVCADERVERSPHFAPRGPPPPRPPLNSFGHRPILGGHGHGHGFDSHNGGRQNGRGHSGGLAPGTSISISKSISISSGGKSQSTAQSGANASSRKRRQLGLAGAVLAAPAAILAAPAVALGQASYGPSYTGPGYGRPGYGNPPAASFSSSKSFSIGGGNAQSSANSGAGYKK